ncbi:MAG: phosphonate metabolism protein/1,5-bisphosphokinase (PRPP-forming) PhnN [Paracoccaceae bacterium]|nr:phosphonate metabolism protein/1,5-bisphosphokinase (PRPP-forming) PhnN [Paracoccaceae bacterium]
MTRAGRVSADRVFIVVGPSGAGKDTLIDAARAARPDIRVLRRVITRPEAAGGEDFEGVSPAEFTRRKAAGDFVLDWQAHGLCYGIPRAGFAGIGPEQCAVFNGSRAMLAAAKAAFAGLVVIHVTAPLAVLAARLAARGREAPADIVARLERAGYDLPADLDCRVVDNGGTRAQGIAGFLAALQPERG